MMQKFIRDGAFVRCDHIFPCQKLPTCVNEVRNQSYIDFVLTSAASDIEIFVIAAPCVNFSDHLPFIFEIATI